MLWQGDGVGSAEEEAVLWQGDGVGSVVAGGWGQQCCGDDRKSMHRQQTTFSTAGSPEYVSWPGWDMPARRAAPAHAAADGG